MMEVRGMKAVVLERVFDAPRELVFAAWTEPERLAQWWGPKMFTNPVCRLDARPGGEIYVEMRGPDGTVYPMSGRFQEVTVPERLVFITAALDSEGHEIFEMQHQVDFRKAGKRTAVRAESRLTKTTPEAARYLAGHRIGYTQSFDKLTELMAGGRRIVTTRFFDAPRELVYSMWTDAAHIGKWWGPRGFTTTTSVMDVRPGGEWRHVMRAPGGREFLNHIVYLEVAPPERLVYEHVSEPHFRATATFSSRAGETEVTFELEFETAALRDQVARDFGAVRGQEETMSRLEEALSALLSAR